mmetsp:Transcript_12876/g.51402  ORF Transcript_12876/g.51402 Transcript_12876/m.51402 type:complete len:229 (+) Transcript_12876:2009-2695(+)
MTQVQTWLERGSASMRLSRLVAAAPATGHSATTCCEAMSKTSTRPATPSSMWSLKRASVEAMPCTVMRFSKENWLPFSTEMIQIALFCCCTVATHTCTLLLDTAHESMARRMGFSTSSMASFHTTLPVVALTTNSMPSAVLIHTVSSLSGARTTLTSSSECVWPFHVFMRRPCGRYLLREPLVREASSNSRSFWLVGGATRLFVSIVTCPVVWLSSSVRSAAPMSEMR